MLSLTKSSPRRRISVKVSPSENITWARSIAVELFLNGQSLGRQPMKRNSHLRWKVKYAPGVLSAKGYRAGQVVGEARVETTGAPASVQLVPDRKAIDADGEDVGIITISFTDARGRVVPVAGNSIQFDLEGPGRLLGVGNADPSCHEPDVFIPQSAVQGFPLKEWRWSKVRDARAPNLKEVAARFDDSAWPALDVGRGEGPLTENKGVNDLAINWRKKVEEWNKQ